MTRFIKHGSKAVLAAVLTLAAPCLLAQGTIKIGMITDRVGPAKAYAEPVAQGAGSRKKETRAALDPTHLTSLSKF